MRLPASFILWLRNRLLRMSATRDPDFIIGSPADPYMRRWFIIPRNAVFNVYLHEFLRSDDDRALHDHPWWNISIILANCYVEQTILAGGVNKRRVYTAGDVKFRAARSAHRVELANGKCWTLFITGPRLREWGFHCPSGWKHWTKFVNPNNRGEIGPGCDNGGPGWERNQSSNQR